MKKTIKTIIATLILAGITTTNAFAYGIINNTEPDVSYSIINAIKANDTTVLQDNSKDTELYLETIPTQGMFSTEPTGDEILQYTLKQSLSKFGVNHSVAEVLSSLTEDYDASNPKYWKEYNDASWLYANDNNDKVKAISFQNVVLGKHIIIRFLYYKNSRELTFDEMYILSPNSYSAKLSLGQVGRFFKEVASLDPKLQYTPNVMTTSIMNQLPSTTINTNTVQIDNTKINNNNSININTANGSTIIINK